MDVMSSHATMKTTRKASQNAFLHLRYILLGMSPELTWDQAYQFVTPAATQGRSNLTAAAKRASAGSLIRASQVKTD